MHYSVLFQDVRENPGGGRYPPGFRRAASCKVNEVEVMLFRRKKFHLHAELVPGREELSGTLINYKVHRPPFNLLRAAGAAMGRGGPLMN